MHIESKVRRRKESKHQNRFYTRLDMAVIKKDAANRKGQIKRGEVKDFGNNYISVCGCGVEGCFIHSGFDSISKEEMNEWQKNKFPHHKPKTKKESYKIDWKSKEIGRAHV